MPRRSPSHIEWLLVSLVLAVQPVERSWAVEVPAPTGERIVAAGAKLEWLFTRTAPIQGGLTEGPAVAPDGSIYFSDIPFGPDPGMILRFDPRTRQTTVFVADSGKSNGLICDAEGRLVACEGASFGGRCMSRWNLSTKERTVLTDRFTDKKYNSPNDVCLDAQGRIYFTDPRYVGDEPRELAHRAVYRIDRDGSVHEVTHSLAKPNGIAISPDERTLYIADHDNGTDRIDPQGPAPRPGNMRIDAFALQADGSVGERKVFYDFGDRKGCDGMTVDATGNVYLTMRDPRSPGVLVLDPGGRQVGFIPTGPADQVGPESVGLPSNVEFGLGEEIHTLYITVDKSLCRIRLLTSGFHRQFAGR